MPLKASSNVARASGMEATGEEWNHRVTAKARSQSSPAHVLITLSSLPGQTGVPVRTLGLMDVKYIHKAEKRIIGEEKFQFKI